MPIPNGFAVSSKPSVLGIKTVRVPGTDVDLPVRGDVAPLLIGFAAEFHEKVEPLRRGACWGYAYREVRGGYTPSFHAAGLAIDLNAPAHPLGQVGTFNGAQTATIRELAHKYGLRWGGDYSGRRDEMHVEVILDRPDALALVRKLTAVPSHAAARRLRLRAVLRMRGDDVRALQRQLNAAGVRPPVEVDGVFGRDTDSGVRAFQTTHHLTADGVVGPLTRAALEKAAK